MERIQIMRPDTQEDTEGAGRLGTRRHLIMSVKRTGKASVVASESTVICKSQEEVGSPENGEQQCDIEYKKV
jgi:hypothetical protein